jgi:hypothetical protein
MLKKKINNGYEPSKEEYNVLYQIYNRIGFSIGTLGAQGFLLRGISI